MGGHKTVIKHEHWTFPWSQIHRPVKGQGQSLLAYRAVYSWQTFPHTSKEPGTEQLIGIHCWSWSPYRYLHQWGRTGAQKSKQEKQNSQITQKASTCVHTDTHTRQFNFPNNVLLRLIIKWPCVLWLEANFSARRGDGEPYPRGEPGMEISQPTMQII